MGAASAAFLVLLAASGLLPLIAAGKLERSSDGSGRARVEQRLAASRCSFIPKSKRGLQEEVEPT